MSGVQLYVSDFELVSSKKMKGVILAAIVMVAIIELIAQPAQALTCGKVHSALAPCIPYLTRGGEPEPECCIGVRTIKGMAQSTAEKREACSCLKQAANLYANLKDDAAQALPTKCGVQIDIPVSRSTNCNLIN